MRVQELAQGRDWVLIGYWYAMVHERQLVVVITSASFFKSTVIHSVVGGLAHRSTLSRPESNLSNKGDASLRSDKMLKIRH